MEWQLHEAKARFSELAQKALDEGPPTVTRRGKPGVVILSIEQYKLMEKRQISLKEASQAVPWHELETERDKSPPRDVDP